MRIRSRSNRKAAYLLSEGYVLGSVIAVSLYRWLGGWAAFAFEILTFIVWITNMWLLDHPRGVGGSVR